MVVSEVLVMINSEITNSDDFEIEIILKDKKNGKSSKCLTSLKLMLEVETLHNIKPLDMIVSTLFRELEKTKK